VSEKSAHESAARADALNIDLNKKTARSPGDSPMKTLSIVTAAIFLSLGSAAMANDSGENHQDDTNSTGPNPFMTFSDPVYRGGGYEAFAKQPVHHHVVHSHVKK
jgi:hypothetical protein